MKGEFREYIYNCSQGFFVGFTSLRLGEYILNQETLNEYNDLISKTKEFFLNNGNEIPKENGKMTIEVSDEIDYHF